MDGERGGGMWTILDHGPGEAAWPGVPGGTVDGHLATIPACAALGLRETSHHTGGIALAVDPQLPAVRARDGGVDPGAALLLADQATANGIFATLDRFVPMMTLGLRVDWAAPAPAAPLVCAIDDVMREGELALVRGTLTAGGAIVGAAAARYLMGAMPGGFRDQPRTERAEPLSSAASFDDYLGAEAIDGGLCVTPMPAHVGARELPAFHGGVIAALIERTARNAVGDGFRVLDVDLRYLAPGRADRPLMTRAVPRRLGRRVATVDVAAYQDDPERPVAIGRVMAVADTPAALTAYRIGNR